MGQPGGVFASTPVRCYYYTTYYYTTILLYYYYVLLRAYLGLPRELGQPGGVFASTPVRSYYITLLIFDGSPVRDPTRLPATNALLQPTLSRDSSNTTATAALLQPKPLQQEYSHRSLMQPQLSSDTTPSRLGSTCARFPFWNTSAGRPQLDRTVTSSPSNVLTM